MRRILLALMFLFFAVSALAQNFDFPNAPTLNQTVSGPAGQLFQWDGTKWIALGATTGGVGPFLPLAGGTLTGPLNGTTITTSDVITANGPVGGTAITTPWTISGGNVRAGAAFIGSIWQQTQTPSLRQLSYNSSLDSLVWIAGAGSSTFLRVNGTSGVTTLGANGVSGFDAVTVQQMNAAIAAIGGPFLPVNNPTATGVLTAPQVVVSSTSQSLTFGPTVAAPNANLFSTSIGSAHFAGGMHFDGTNWHADYATPTDISQWNGGIHLYADTGQTIGAVFTPTEVVTIDTTGLKLNVGTLLLPNGAQYQSLRWTSATQPWASIASGAANNLNMSAGAHIVTTPSIGWQADSTAAETVTLSPSQPGNIAFYANTGLTPGTSFTPLEIAKLNASGFNIESGTLFLNGVNQFTSGTFVPVLTCTGGAPSITTGSQVGQWWTAGHMLFYYIQAYWNSSTGGAGQAVITGIPYAPAYGTGGQGGWTQHVVSTNAATTRGTGARLIATIFQGEAQIRFYDGAPFGGDYLVTESCGNIWANTPSGVFLTGFYAYQ